MKLHEVAVFAPCLSARPLLSCRWSIPHLLVCRWSVAGLSLVCRWSIVGLLESVLLSCRWSVAGLSARVGVADASLVRQCSAVVLSLLCSGHGR